MTLPAGLATAWPVPDPPAGDYRAATLAGTRLLAVVALAPAAAIAVAEGEDGLRVVPVVADPASGWRAAAPGDGVASALAHALATGRALADPFVLRPSAPMAAPVSGGERAMGVDQTNASVVVDELLVVKWYTRPALGAARGPRLLRHLLLAGFPAAPALFGTLEWRPSGDGTPAVTLAMVDAFLPGVEDGWDWAPAAVLVHAQAGHRCGSGCPAAFPAALGRLTAALHLALASPTDEIPAPTTTAAAGTISGWADAGERTLDEAVARTAADDPGDGALLRAWAPVLRDRIGTLRRVTTTTLQPVHGDLHVGQLPRWQGGVAVIDFDGNPTLSEDERAAPQPAARDLAQLLCSLDHVGRVAARRAGDATAVAATEAWIAGAQTACLDAYRSALAAAARPDLLDDRLLPAFMAEQECRELVYAARFLPRWRYAPMGAIRAMVEP